MDNKKIITLVGGIGVGKTTLLSELAQMFKSVQTIEENAEQNLYLNEFYENPRKWGFHSRISMISMVATNYKKMEEDKEIYIFDRCIPELIVFANLEYELGNMTEKEYKLYIQLYDAFCHIIPKIDAYIYLTCSEENSLKRIQQRGRKCEQNVKLDFLSDIKQRYDLWAQKIENKIWINTDNYIDINKTVSQIKTMLKIEH